MVRAVDRDRIARIVENVDSFTQSLGESRQVIRDALKDAGALVKSLNESAPKLDAALSEVSKVARALDSEKLGRTVENVDRFAQSLGRSSGDVEKTVAEARQLAEKFQQIRGPWTACSGPRENFLGSASGEAGKGTFDEIREAARSIRGLADNLDKRTAELTAGVNKFTGSGLREYEALAAEDARPSTTSAGR